MDFLEQSYYRKYLSDTPIISTYNYYELEVISILKDLPGHKI